MTRKCPQLIHIPGADLALRPDPFSAVGEWGYSGCGRPLGGRHNLCKLLLYFSSFRLLRKYTHTACSDSPCDTKSTKKLGVGDLRGGQAGDQSLRERGKDWRERIDSSVENGERAGKGSDRAASGRCGLRRSLVAAVFSTSAPSANAFWGKGFRLLSYVQQAQTAKRFAKGRVCWLLQSAAAAFSPGCLRTPEPSRLGLPSALQRGSAFHPERRPPRSRPSRRPPTIPPFLHTVRDPPTQSAQPRARCVESERRSAEGDQGSRCPASTPLQYPSTPSLPAYLSYHPLSPIRVPPAPVAMSRISEQVQFGFSLNPLLSLLVPQQRFQP